jgi:hypothetical protein
MGNVIRVPPPARAFTAPAAMAARATKTYSKPFNIDAFFLPAWQLPDTGLREWSRTSARLVQTFTYYAI